MISLIKLFFFVFVFVWHIINTGLFIFSFGFIRRRAARRRAWRGDDRSREGSHRAGASCQAGVSRLITLNCITGAVWLPVGSFEQERRSRKAALAAAITSARPAARAQQQYQQHGRLAGGQVQQWTGRKRSSPQGNCRETMLSAFLSRSITKLAFTVVCYPQRTPTEKAYYIAKELLMTERTYKKDLEVIDLVRRTRHPVLSDYWPIPIVFQWFRDELSKEEYMPEEVLTLLFNHVDPLYEHHTLLLKDMEHRLAAWYVEFEDCLRCFC